MKTERMPKDRFENLKAVFENGDPIKDVDEDDWSLAEALIAEREYAEGLEAKDDKTE